MFKKLSQKPGMGIKNQGHGNSARRIVVTMMMLMLVLCMAVPAFADDWSDSTIATGINNLITDLSGWLVILCPIVGAAFAVYYAIRRGAADETDGKMWTKRIVTAIVCGVGGGLVSGIISIIAGYFTE